MNGRFWVAFMKMLDTLWRADNADEFYSVNAPLFQHIDGSSGRTTRRQHGIEDQAH